MFKKLLCLVSVCTFGFLAQTALAADETAGVNAAVEQLRVLMVTPDKAALEAIVADGLSYGHSGGKIDTKTSFIDDLLTGASDFVSIELSDQTVRVSGNAAFVRHTLFGATADKGKMPGTVKLHILSVWEKQGGKWKLAARQAVRI